jgi:hypothetical protein
MTMKHPEPFTRTSLGKFASREEWDDFGWAIAPLESDGDLTPLAQFLLRGKPLSAAVATALGHILSGELLGLDCLDVNPAFGGEGPFVVKAVKYTPPHRATDYLKSHRAFDASAEVYRRVKAGEPYTKVLREVAKKERVTLNLLAEFVEQREENSGPLPRAHPPTHTKKLR